MLLKNRVRRLRCILLLALKLLFRSLDVLMYGDRRRRTWTLHGAIEHRICRSMHQHCLHNLDTQIGQPPHIRYYQRPHSGVRRMLQRHSHISIWTTRSPIQPHKRVSVAQQAIDVASVRARSRLGNAIFLNSRQLQAGALEAVDTARMQRQGADTHTRQH